MIVQNNSNDRATFLPFLGDDGRKLDNGMDDGDEETVRDDGSDTDPNCRNAFFNRRISKEKIN